MKVVLAQDVDNLGDRGEIVNVKPGYARNFLLPKRLALIATPGNLRSLELRKKAWAARDLKEVDQAREFAAKLSEVSVAISKKVGESETLYGSVTAAEIAQALEGRGFVVDKRKIHLGEPIKSLGEHKVPVRVHRQVTAEIVVQVVPEAV